MKLFVRGVAGFVLVLVAWFLFNATDLSLSSASREMLLPFSVRAGFSLKDLKQDSLEKVPRFDFDTYKDYLADSSQLDSLVDKYQGNLVPLLKAFRAGAVSVEPVIDNLNSVLIYSLDVHRLFLVSISQKIKRGHLSEALTVLEESNRFLLSVLERPQALLNKAVALAALNENARFVKSLKEEKVLKSFPNPLKASFSLSQSAKEIYNGAVKVEFQSGHRYVTSVHEQGLDIRSLADLPENMWSPLLKSMGTRFLRPHQTMNWMAQIFQEIGDSACTGVEVQACSETFRDVVQSSGIFSYFSNPVGRDLLKVMMLKYGGQLVKFEKSVDELNALVASLK